MCFIFVRSGSIESGRSEQSKTSSVRQHAARVRIIHSNALIAKNVLTQLITYQFHVSIVSKQRITGTSYSASLIKNIL